AIEELINAYNEVHPDTPIEVENLPSYKDVTAKGLGAFLRRPPGGGARRPSAALTSAPPQAAARIRASAGRAPPARPAAARSGETPGRRFRRRPRSRRAPPRSRSAARIRRARRSPTARRH